MTDVASAATDPLDPSGSTLGPGSAAAVAVAGRTAPASWRQLLVRKPTFLVGAVIIGFWIVCAIFGHQIAPDNPLAQQLLSNNAPPSGAHWFWTRVVAGMAERLEPGEELRDLHQAIVRGADPVSTELSGPQAHGVHVRRALPMDIGEFTGRLVAKFGLPVKGWRGRSS